MFEIGHLHSRGGVHAVGCLHERYDEYRLQLRGQSFALDRFADRVDPFAVMGLEISRAFAERLGEVAGLTFQVIELRDEEFRISSDIF